MTDALNVGQRFGAGGKPDPKHCPCPSYMPAPLPPEWERFVRWARFAPKGEKVKRDQALRAYVHDALRDGTTPTLKLRSRDHD